METRKKLSAFAASQGITYQAAWKLWQQGEIEGIKLESGTILVSGWVNKDNTTPKAVIYGRVSIPDNAEVLEEKLTKAKQYVEDNNYELVECYQEIIPGMVFNRPELDKLLDNPDWNILVVNDYYELSQFNFHVLEKTLQLSGRRIELLNPYTRNGELLVLFSQKFLNWAKQIMGMGHQKKALMELLKEINK